MPTWVPVARAAKFPEVNKVYKRAGEGQGTGQGTPAAPNTNSSLLNSAPMGFLKTVQNFVRGNNPDGTSVGYPLPAWIRQTPGITNSSWQDYQVDVTNIPGVRPLRKDGKYVNAS